MRAPLLGPSWVSRLGAPIRRCRADSDSQTTQSRVLTKRQLRMRTAREVTLIVFRSDDTKKRPNVNGYALPAPYTPKELTTVPGEARDGVGTIGEASRKKGYASAKLEKLH